MLKQRLITAAILIPLVVWAIFALSTPIVMTLFVLVAGLAAWEWLSLMRLSTPVKVLSLVGLAAVILVSHAWLTAISLLNLVAFIWLLATVMVLVFAHKPLTRGVQSLFRSPVFGVLLAILILTGFVIGAVQVHALTHGAALLLFVMVTVWLADTGGYFAGKRYGKTKLATAISPNKTWEGVAGAIVLSSIWSLGFYLLLNDLPWSVFSWLAFTWLIVAVSIIGDLLESVFKRVFDVKDSGHLLPGHGGILDRIDSLLAAIPVFAVLLLGAA